MNHEGDIQTRRVCASIDTLAMSYLDGELEGADLRELEVHLVDCATCRARVDAEAASLGTLRTALAAPPASELLRARIGKALDGEDRAARRRRGPWALPATAAVAAVGALALFVGMGRPASERAKPVESDVLANVRRGRPLEVQGAATSPWIQTHFDPGVEVPVFADVRVDRWGARLVEVRDREAAQVFYRVTTASGRESDVAVVIFDAHGLRLAGHARQVINGRELLVSRLDGASVVSLRDRDQRAYIFTSTQLTPDELAGLVGRSSLLVQVREDDR